MKKEELKGEFKKFKELVLALRSKKMLLVFLLGFSSGLPIILLYSNLKLWLRNEGVDLSTIGYLSWVTIPYSINFIWAPLLDRYRLFRSGRRKSWILASQMGLGLSMLSMSFASPAESIVMIAAIGGLICFFSATQDVAIDAYRREILEDEELGVGAAIHVYGYRIAMWVTGGFGVWITDANTWNLSFQESFVILAGFVLVGVVACVLCEEPKIKEGTPQSLRGAVIQPFQEFLKRPQALGLLAFVLLYKFGDSMAGTLTRPFYADMGFSNATIGEIPATLGLFSTMAGLFLGGIFIFRFGVYKALLVAGVLQAVSTMSFSILTFTGPVEWALAGVVVFEDVSGGMGTAALVAAMSFMANKQFTATQYALLASLASLGRTFFSGYAGVMAEGLGYQTFFIVCGFLAIPGLIFILVSKKQLKFHE